MTGTCEGRWVPVSWPRAWTPQGTRSIRCCPWVRGRSQGLGSADAPLQDTGDAVLRPPADLGGRSQLFPDTPLLQPSVQCEGLEVGSRQGKCAYMGAAGGTSTARPRPLAGG